MDMRIRRVKVESERPRVTRNSNKRRMIMFHPDYPVPTQPNDDKKDAPELSECTQLLACPFCGGDAETDNPRNDTFTVGCVEGCVSMPCGDYTHYFKSEEDAIKRWNKRAS